MEEKLIPRFVKIISLIYIIKGFLGILFWGATALGMMWIIGSTLERLAVVIQIMTSIFGLEEGLLTQLALFFNWIEGGNLLLQYSSEKAVMFSILGALQIFMGINIYKGKKWARFTVMTITSLTAVISLIVIASPWRFGSIGLILTSILLNGIIASYLIFNKKVKEAFSNK